MAGKDKMKSGIYTITNIINNYIYIGSSKNVNKRLKEHFRMLKNNKHVNKKLQNGINKYGIHNFIFKQVLCCEIQHLLCVEQNLMDLFNPEYNLAKHTSAPMLGRKHTKETKEKISKLHKGTSRLKGYKQSIDHIEKCNRYKIGSKRSLKTRLKMSQTAKRVNSIARINYENIRKKIIDSNGLKFDSITDCRKFHKISASTVCDILKGRHTATKNCVKFMYLDDFNKLSEYYKNVFFIQYIKRSKNQKRVTLYLYNKPFISFYSLTELAKYINSSTSEISRSIKKGSILRNKYKVQYV